MDLREHPLKISKEIAVTPDHAVTIVGIFKNFSGERKKVIRGAYAWVEERTLKRSDLISVAFSLAEELATNLPKEDPCIESCALSAVEAEKELIEAVKA